MKVKELNALEEWVANELKIADVCKFTINLNDIKDIRDYFIDRPFNPLNVIIESSYPVTPGDLSKKDLSKKYTAVFSKKMGDN